MTVRLVTAVSMRLCIHWSLKSNTKQ